MKNKGGSTGIRVKNGATGVNDGNIETKGSMNMGMYAKNATIINNGNIETNSTVKYIDDSYKDGDNFIEQRGMGFSYETAMEGREKSYIENNGTIVGTGSIFGMVARTGSTAVNKGDIEITGKVQKYEGSEDILYDDNGYLNKNMISYSEGMRARENSEISNEGNISIVGGQGRGIDVKTESIGKNQGNIYLEGSEIVVKRNWGDETKSDYTTYGWTAGMRSRENSTVINEEKGIITIKGRGAGLEARKNSKAINNGQITIEAKYEISLGENECYSGAQIAGMTADESEIINNGRIELINDGQGMKAFNNSSATNNGDIIVSGELNWNYHVKGMELRTSEGINNGNIIVTGKAEQKGVTVDEYSNFINKGKIEVETNGNYAQGISVSSSSEGSVKEVINDGIIKVYTNRDTTSNDESYYVTEHAVGIISSRSVINNGEIYAETDGGRATGIEVHGENTLAINNKLINIEGKNAYLVGISSQYGSSV